MANAAMTAAQGGATRATRSWDLVERLWKSVPTPIVALIPCLTIAIADGWNLGQKSLWLDGATVANTVLRGDYLDPEYLHTTPVGFALLLGLVVHLFGSTETWFRLLPFLFGVGAVLGTFLVALRMSGSRVAALVAAMLVATNLDVLGYAQQIKPYTADLFAAIVIILVADRLVEKPTRPRWLAYTLTITLAPLISFPSVFVSAVTAGVLLVVGLRRGGRREIAPWFAAHAIAGVLVGIYGWFFLFTQRSSGGLVAAWATGFPSQTSTFSVPLLYLRQTVNVVKFFFLIGPGARLELLGAGGLIVGVVLALRQHPRYAAYFLGPLGMVAAASVPRLYPFDASRLMLFLLPGFMILAATGLVAVARAASGITYGHVAGIVLVGLALYPGARSTHAILFHPLLDVPGATTEETRDLVTRDLRSALQPGDLVYVYYGAGPAFQYYSPELRHLRLAFGNRLVTTENGATVDFGAIHRDDPSAAGTELLSDLRTYQPRRLWILISHDQSPQATREVASLLATARQCGSPDLDVRTVGGHLVRFDPPKSGC